MTGNAEDEAERQRRSADPFASAITLAQLAKMEFPSAEYLVPPLLMRRGLVLCAGPPKLGKSYMALGIGMAVASGGAALGSLQVEAQGPVLYLSLDDTSTARAQQRARQIARSAELPEAFTLHTEHSLGRGERARDSIGRYLSGRGRGTSLVVIDTISHLRVDRRSTEGVYDADVRFMSTLRTLLTVFPDLTLLCLTHVRKQVSADGVEAVTGTYGIAGGADSIITMSGNRHAPGRLIEVVNRDDEGGEYALRFGPHGLEFARGVDPHDATLFLSEGDAEVYRMLVKYGRPASAAELAVDLDGIVDNIGNRLARLVRHGVVQKVARGKYEAL